MASSKKCLCSECDHFIDKLDNTGYCKFYCHTVAEQKDECSAFAEKSFDTSTSKAGIADSRFMISEGEDSKSTFKNVSLIIALFGSSIFFLILFFVCVCIPTFSLNLNSGWYSFFVLLMTAVFFGLMTLSFIAIGKSVVARIVFIVVPIPLLILMMINYDSFWFAVSDFIITLFSSI